MHQLVECNTYSGFIVSAYRCHIVLSGGCIVYILIRGYAEVKTMSHLNGLAALNSRDMRGEC